jgi:disulfide bond formation protein DsbB
LTDTWFTFFALLTVLANVATLALWGLTLAARVDNRAAETWARTRSFLGEAGLPIAAFVAVVATAGSLYLSEGAHLVPCRLCWYQRCAMYPLAALLVVAVIRRDWSVRPYALTLAVAGPVISTYHYVIERFPGLEIGHGGCDPSNPCTITLVWKFHYISIPFMALSAFVLVATVLLAARPDTWEEVPARDHGSDGHEDATPEVE